VVDNAGTLDVARALAITRAIGALVDGGATTSALPLLAELEALLEGALADGASVVSLAAERARRSR
jgi:hypothetical protein